MVELDEVDKKILRELQKDARTSFKTIAKNIGVSAATIFVRVKRLTKTGVLKGFKAIVEPKAVGKSRDGVHPCPCSTKSLPCNAGCPEEARRHLRNP